MDSKLAATQLHWDLQPRLQGGLCHISAPLLRGALSGHLGEEFNGLFRGPLDDAMPHIEDVMSPPSISYTLFHCFMDHILSAKQDHWINITLQMQYPNGKLEFQLLERNTDKSYSLHPYYKSLVPNLMSILETEERTDMTHSFSKLTLGSPWVPLGSPCSQCQTHCAYIVLYSNPCVVQCTKGVILPGEHLHHQIMILLGASLWPNPSEPQHPDADIELLCAVCKFPICMKDQSNIRSLCIDFTYDLRKA